MKRVRIILATLLLLLLVTGTSLAYTSLEMFNASGSTIYSVYLSPSDSKNWGTNKLRGVWHHGDTLTLSVAGARYWDLKVYWDGDNYTTFSSLDTDRIYGVRIIRKSNGGYRAVFDE